MSWVATVMLSVAFDEDPELVDEFSCWLDRDAPWNGPAVPPGATGVGNLLPLHKAHEWWGGPKNPEARVWAAATNHADIDAVVARFGSTRWLRPAAAQLFVQDQEEDYFQVWMIHDGVARRLTPEPG